VLADLHGRPGALRRILAAAAVAGADEVICLGDYLEAKVPRRLHDPSRFWPLERVIDPDPALWARLIGIRRVLGNQELRIRELLRPEQIPADLAALLDAPEQVRLHGLVGLHGHQIRWSTGRAELAGGPGAPVGTAAHGAADGRGLLVPVAADVPRVPVVVVGHTHQEAMFEIAWSDTAAGSVAAGGLEAPAAVVRTLPPVEPGRPFPVPRPDGDYGLAIVGPARGPSPAPSPADPRPAGVGPAGVGPAGVRPSAGDSSGAGPSAGDSSGAGPSGGGPSGAATLVVNVGPARGKPSHWMLYDTDRGEISFQRAVG
jgi:predicted phosphodiesterase